MWAAFCWVVHFNWIVCFVIYSQSSAWMLWRGSIASEQHDDQSCHQKPHIPKLPASLCWSLQVWVCLQSHWQRRRGRRCCQVGDQSCTSLPSSSSSIQVWPAWSATSTAAGEEGESPKHPPSTLGQLRAMLPGGVGWLRSRACWVAVVAMEQQDKKQVSLVA